MICNILFTILFILQGISAQNCQLDASKMYKNWIYIIKPTPQEWDVLHTDYLQDQTSLYLFCYNDPQILVIRCNRGNLILPRITQCNSAYPSNIKSMNNEVSCGAMDGNFYQVQFNLPDGTFIKLYEICYSQKNERVVYTRHSSFGFNALINNYEGPQFLPHDVVSMGCVNSYKTDKIYNTFVSLLGKKQTYIKNNRDSVIERGHLVNVQDFLTSGQKRSTYKYANVMPQFRGSNRSNWSRIENWIRRLVTPGTHAEIVTGSFDVLSLPHADPPNVNMPMYLMEGNKNPIPLWLYKVVKYADICHVLLSLNNQFNTNKNITATNCIPTECPRGLEFSKELKHGVSHCCDYDYFKNNFGSQVSLC